MPDSPEKSRRVVRGVCPHDCPDRCVWLVTVENGKAIKLVGDPDHPFTNGGLCAKVNNYLEDRAYSPQRLLYPLRRVGPKGSDEFERVSWSDALDDVAARLQAIIEQYGGEAVMPYSFAGNQGVVQMNAGNRFFARIGATRLERNMCGVAGSTGLHATLGTNMGMLPEDIAQSRFIILWGTNTIVTNLHLWRYVREAKNAGATIVVIDPLKTRTAREADWHVRPMPGTDAALALGMMNVIVSEGLHDEEYVLRYTEGFDQLCERLREYTPERVAEITGLDADEISRLARAFATTKPAAIRMLVGMEHHANGAMAYRTVACLPALVGAWRELGGGLLFSTTSAFAVSLNMNAVLLPELESEPVRSVNMAQLGKALNDPDLDPPIHALIIYNSNPATIAPNHNLVTKGLSRNDLFIVAHDHFLTDSARYADYVFPATTAVENLDLYTSWGHTYITMNRPAIEPVGEAVSNSELFRMLAAHMGLDEQYLHDSDEDRIRAALASEHPYLKDITFERLMEDGWAELNLPEDRRPFAEGGYPTRSGKCEFYSQSLAARGIDPLPVYEPPPESKAGDPELAARFPLALITAKSSLRFINSSYANLPRHIKAEGEPYLDIHPNDADARGVSDGDSVCVYNDRGAVELRIRVGDRVRPGVVAMPSGWWASLSPNGYTANALTSDSLSDMGRGGNFYDTLVEVARVE